MKTTIIKIFTVSLMLSLWPSLLASEDLIENFSKLNLRAEQGDVEAQFELGFMYDFGSGVEKDASKAVYWYQKAANQGDATAQFFLGSMYDYGNGGEKDDTMAVYWYKKAAEQGNVSAQVVLGSKYYKGEGVIKDISKAICLYKKAAEQGDVEAQFELGDMYANGKGVSIDGSVAAYWYQKAAEKGKYLAQIRLGLMYEGGKGVAKDISKALYWYQKAAEDGDYYTQFKIGSIYENGNGVAKDAAKAVYWYQKAADQEYVLAQFRLGCMYGVGKGVTKDASKAVYWFQKAANQGDATAQNNLGVMYEKGEGVVKDASKAVYWYQKAANLGNATAQSNLGHMYAAGEGVTKDASKAVYWFQKAANQGDATAQYNLGVMYAAGEGVTKDEVEALSWFYIAKSNGEEVKNIYTIENHLGSIGTLLAQKRAREISEKISSQKSGVPIDMPEKDVAGNEVNKSYSSSGSGVFVSADGLLLTAAHVITGANEIKIVTVNGVVQADIVQIDKANDVAMLRCKGNFKAARVINSRVVRLGQDVFTIGFPQITLQGFNHKFTDGKISSLSGAHDDPREWQISIPVQPGNSGGPLFDVNGNLVGIVVSKLNELEVAKETGNLPQNVNYALKSAYIRPLLEENGVEISEPFKTAAKLEDVVAKALHSVALVLCYE